MLTAAQTTFIHESDYKSKNTRTIKSIGETNKKLIRTTNPLLDQCAQRNWQQR